jgi:murein DD-endopeptidase MepM/ murein hydrolase activator NlpD
MPAACSLISWTARAVGTSASCQASFIALTSIVLGSAAGLEVAQHVVSDESRRPSWTNVSFGVRSTGSRTVARTTAVPLVLAMALLFTPLAPVAAQPDRAAATRGPYDWPLQPFDRPHPVRGYLDDPRMGSEEGAQAFHIGIDISVGRETPVFAVERGVVHFIDARAIAIASGARTLQYWHIAPAVRNGQYVPRHALLGRTLAAFNHLHLSEVIRRRYVNPLRLGALTPFEDSTVPTIGALAFLRAGRALGAGAVSGTVDIVVDCFDTAAGVEPAPWPVAAAVIRWRLVTGADQAGVWHTAVDFRSAVLPSSRFALVYAPGTRPNRRGRPGRFRFYLAHGWRSTGVANGAHVLEVAASDMRGNTDVELFPFDVTN